MPGRIDFYLLNSPTGAGQRALACKVIEKAFTSGLPVALCVEDDEQAASLDDLLWTWSQGSFVPHGLARNGGDEPVQIHVQAPPLPLPHNVMVVSLLRNALDEPYLHHRIADIIGDDDTSRAEARQRFKYYRDRGIEPNTHKI